MTVASVENPVELCTWIPDPNVRLRSWLVQKLRYPSVLRTVPMVQTKIITALKDDTMLLVTMITQVGMRFHPIKICGVSHVASSKELLQSF